MSQPVVAILVAAGLGVRYGGSTAKPALKLTGRALITLSIEAMAAGGCTQAVVVVNPDTVDQFRSELAASPIPVHIVHGGATRQESVRNGLEFISSHRHLREAEVVLVHDAVRPLLPANVCADVVAQVRAGHPAVAPALRVMDSIRRVLPDGSSEVVDRSELRAIQTPQGFPLAVILEAHRAAAHTDFTDDISVAQAVGHPVTLVEGARLGMKITEPDDLTIARALAGMRSGLGQHSGRRLRRHLRRLLGKRA